jgi:hypothetical protein
MFNTRLQWAAYAVPLPDIAWHLCLGTSHVTLLKENRISRYTKRASEKLAPELQCDRSHQVSAPSPEEKRVNTTTSRAPRSQCKQLVRNWQYLAMKKFMNAHLERPHPRDTNNN